MSAPTAEQSRALLFPLTGDVRINRRCATEGCPGQPAFRFEAGGVGSNYCTGCASKITGEIDRLASDPGR